MSLKRESKLMAEFSMASMTDVIFLLLIFFMVTSTFVFPTALEINLPQSSKQTVLKPATKVYIDKSNQIYATSGDSEPTAMDLVALLDFLKEQAAQSVATDGYIAVYADEEVTYGTLVKVLDLGAQNNLKMVLATKPAPVSVRPSTNEI